MKSWFSSETLSLLYDKPRGSQAEVDSNAEVDPRKFPATARFARDLTVEMKLMVRLLSIVMLISTGVSRFLLLGEI